MLQKPTIIGLLAILLVTLSSATKPEKKTNSQVNWMTFEEAIEASKSEPRKIFIDIYTDWCGWCKKMDAQTFSHPDIASYINENYYAVKFNAEQKESINFKGHEFKFIASGRRGVHELAVALTNNNLSYPMSVFMDEEYKILSPVPGYQKAPFFDAVLKYFGEEKYKQMKWEEFYNQYDSPIGD